VYEDLGNYDEVFEKLYYKYKDSVDMAPELQLVSMLATSGFMFHLNKKMLDNSSVPQIDEILKRRPDILRQVQQEALGSMRNPFFGGGMNNENNNNIPTSSFNNNSSSIPFPVNAELNPDISKVPQGQGINESRRQQQTMKGPQGFDDILKELEPDFQQREGLVSDVEELSDDNNVRKINTKNRQKKNRFRNKKLRNNNNNIIDIDI